MGGWFMPGFFMLIIFAIIIWLVLRNRTGATQSTIPTASCPKCSGTIQASFFRCPHCGETIKHNCPNCSRVIEHDWTFCPYCNENQAANNMASKNQQ